MRRWYFRDGLSQREITKRTGLSRNTVRRYLKNEIETLFTLSGKR
jgi:DNA-binding transcriptional regulator LsrR (DeoR family)